ncbi:alpha/beta fold hydrolase [Nocardioides sp. CFH 31398]|uniref:alpha/beta fold hydrolase n=1 Tax=Nocardioides sp. CFH 31398 TaxID=2919579 RepID=UPI001F05589A|nr:alpha/beta hydrolase [Nocardioides sp. CFH 31398]MCH1868516.1 alpha/beta hydrolase [Nocardioides sp. CFH 31398]
MSLDAPAYRTTTVAVDGGDLTVGVWGPDDPDAPTVVAVHGITASHRCWPLVAEALPGTRVVAPDLRGRGRSADLPAPYGMARHAADVAAVLDALVPGPVTLAGHSMGGFVVVHLAALVPDRVTSLLLVDGGLPLPAPSRPAEPAEPAEPAGDAGGPDVAAALGPAAQRLTMTFASREAYRDFWRDHPAFASEWNPAVEDYLDYDLRGTEPELRPSTRVEAMAADGAELFGHPAHLAALDAVAEAQVPVTFLRAPRGLMDEPEPLYPTAAVEAAAERLPLLAAYDVEDVNHYTILLSPAGALTVAERLRG